eukprot:570353-Rhodomonas_salina.2
MSGTDLGCSATYLRGWYAMSGTDLGSPATYLRERYAMRGTNGGYGGSRQRRRLRAFRSLSPSASGLLPIPLRVSTYAPAVYHPTRLLCDAQ